MMMKVYTVLTHGTNSTTFDVTLIDMRQRTAREVTFRASRLTSSVVVVCCCQGMSQSQCAFTCFPDDRRDRHRRHRARITEAVLRIAHALKLLFVHALRGRAADSANAHSVVVVGWVRMDPLLDAEQNELIVLLSCGK